MSENTSDFQDFDLEFSDSDFEENENEIKSLKTVNRIHRSSIICVGQLSELDTIGVNQKDQKSKTTADRIINAFTIKNRFSFIDDDNEDELLTYDESILRILYILIFISVIMTVISSIMCFAMILNHQTIKPKESMAFQSKETARNLVPKVGFLFPNGKLEVFQQGQNMTLNYLWSFRVPSKEQQYGYYAYSENGKIFVMYADGTKLTTMIYSNDKTIEFKDLENSKMPFPEGFFYAGTVQIGKLFWILGASKNKGFQ